MNYLMDAVNEARAAADRLYAAAQSVDGEREGKLAIDVKLHHQRWAEIEPLLAAVIPNHAFREAALPKIAERVGALEGEHGLIERFLQLSREHAEAELLDIGMLQEDVMFAGRSGGWLTLADAAHVRNEIDDLRNLATNLEQWAVQSLGDASDPERSILSFLDGVSDEVCSLIDETTAVKILAGKIERATEFVRNELQNLEQDFGEYLKYEITIILDEDLTWRDFAGLTH